MREDLPDRPRIGNERDESDVATTPRALQARRATELALAQAIWEGLRACRLPPDLPALGQIRFSSD